MSASNSALSATPKIKPVPVLLLKTKSTPTDNYEAYFSHSGNYAPQFVPVLDHTFHAANLQTLRRLLTDGNDGAYLRDGDTRYGGLIFTSQRAVEAFDRVVREVGAENKNHLSTLSLPLYVVGPATSRALTALTASHLPSCTVLGAETGNGESLASFILQHYNSLPRPDIDSSERKPALLFLVGEQRRDIIPRTLSSATLPAAQRIAVEEMVVYESGLLRSFETDLAGVLGRIEDAAEGEVEAEVGWVVVFSPTGCGELLRVLEKLGKDKGKEGEGEGEGRKRRRRMFVATIGPTTREYLVREFGFEPDVCAERPSPEGVGDGMRRFMEGRGLAVVRERLESFRGCRRLEGVGG